MSELHLDDLPSPTQILNGPSVDDLPSPTQIMGGGSPGSSKLESLGRGGAQGATLGFGDRMSADTETLMGALDSLMTGSNAFGDEGHLSGFQNAEANYHRALQTQEEQNDQARQANPKTYMTGQLAGSVAPAVLLGQATGFSPLGQASSNAIQSGVNAAGNYRGDDPVELAKSVGGASAVGGALGYGTALAAPALAQGLQTVGGKASDMAERFAVGALGNKRAVINKLAQTGQLHHLGRLALDEGIVTPLASYDTIAERLGSKLSEVGEGIGNIDETADQMLQQFKNMTPQELEGMGIDPSIVNGLQGNQVANSIRSDVVSPMASQAGRVGDSELLDNYLTKEFQNVYGQNDVSLSQLRDFKGNVRSKVNYYGNALNRDAGPQNAFNDLSGSVEDKIEGTLQKLSDAADPELMSKYSDLKNQYGLLSEGAQLSGAKLNAEQANRFLSPSDYYAGGMGFLDAAHEGDNMVESLAKGGAFAGVNQFARKYGNQVASTTLDRIGQALSASPNAMGPYGPMLLNAAKQGPMDMTISHFVLMQTDPKYREYVNRNTGNPNE